MSIVSEVQCRMSLHACSVCLRKTPRCAKALRDSFVTTARTPAACAMTSTSGWVMVSVRRAAAVRPGKASACGPVRSVCHAATRGAAPAGGVRQLRCSAFRPVAAGRESPACARFPPRRCPLTQGVAASSGYGAPFTAAIPADLPRLQNARLDFMALFRDWTGWI